MISRISTSLLLCLLVLSPVWSDTSLADPQTRKTWARLGEFQKRAKNLRVNAVKLRAHALKLNGGKENAQTRQLSRYADQLLLVYRQIPTSGTKDLQNSYITNNLSKHRTTYQSIEKQVAQYQEKFGLTASSSPVSTSSSSSRSSSTSAGKGYQLAVGNFDPKEVEISINGKQVSPGSALKLPSNKTVHLEMFYLATPRKIGRRGSSKTIEITQNTDSLVSYRSTRVNASTRLTLVSEDYHWRISSMDNAWQFKPSGNKATLKTDGNGSLEVRLGCTSDWESVSIRGGKERPAKPVKFTMRTQVLRLNVTPR